MNTYAITERTLVSIYFRRYAAYAIEHGLHSREALKSCYRQAQADARILVQNHGYYH